MTARFASAAVPASEARRLEDVLERSVPPQQLRGRLGADPRRPGQPVGGVAAQGDEVGHELRGDAVALAHLRRADLDVLRALAQLGHRHAL